ncbi:MAG: hypothetical protein FWF88_03340 [Peptococcaceae bacterium]|nr:hypothetical protein [Peptococcaceae bacterium]
MQTSVELQDPFSYSIYPILIAALLILVLSLFLLIRYLIKKKKQAAALEIRKSILAAELETYKQKYLQQLDEIAGRLQNDEISGRTAYQQLSMTIRLFVYEVTHIKVQNCTLSDIEKLDMPLLYELIREYYAPEFSEDNDGDIVTDPEIGLAADAPAFMSSIERTRKVIERWY